MIKLKEIKLPIEEDDKRISEEKFYLAKIGMVKRGCWYAGTFTKEWYGWNLNAVYDAGFQYDYDGWLKLYEIIESKKSSKLEKLIK